MKFRYFYVHLINHTIHIYIYTPFYIFGGDNHTGDLASSDLVVLPSVGLLLTLLLLEKFKDGWAVEREILLKSEERGGSWEFDEE